MGLGYWLVLSSSLFPQTAVENPSAGPQPCLVLRVSKDWVAQRFEQLLPDEFSVGTHLASGRVTGRATNQGQANVQLDLSGQHPAVVLTYTGVTRAQLSGQSGPVSMQGRTTTEFTAVRRIPFDGRKFVDGESTVHTRTALTIDRVNSSRKGVVGNIIRRVGERTVQRNRSQTDAEVRRFAQSQMEDVFDAAADQMTASLNETTCFEQCLRRLFPSLSSWAVQLTESDEHLVLTFSQTSSPELDLPPVSLDTPAVEIWLQVPEYQSRMIAVLASSNRACSWLEWLLGDNFSTLAHLSQDAEVSSQGRWTRIASGHRVTGS